MLLIAVILSDGCGWCGNPQSGEGTRCRHAADSNKIYEIRTDANTETVVFERVESVGQNENGQ
jgi:hypothetical protein